MNFTALEMCRLIQFLYSGIVFLGWCVDLLLYLTYIHNHTLRCEKNACHRTKEQE